MIKQLCPFCQHERCNQCVAFLTFSRDWIDCDICGGGAQLRYWFKPPPIIVGNKCSGVLVNKTSVLYIPETPTVH